ncbi:hypothetical protein HYU07_05605 [Candidatus Woesearchaeota archaeon]|nr:hypothetical protein [Candidatus Woesearchaeota archaeon]
MIYNEYKKTIKDIEFGVKYYMLSDIGYVLEISSSKAAEQKFVKLDLNLECIITGFYGYSYTRIQRNERAKSEDSSLKNEVELNLTDFLKNPRFKLHRQIYEEALQKLKEEIKK